MAKGPGSCFSLGSGSGLEKIMDLDPDPVNIIPDPKPWGQNL